LILSDANKLEISFKKRSGEKMGDHVLLKGRKTLTSAVVSYLLLGLQFWKINWETKVISLPEGDSDRVQAIRQKHDKEYKKWFPHVRLYVFLCSYCHFERVLDSIRSFLQMNLTKLKASLKEESGFNKTKQKK
jgi:hypothetical protein